MRRSLLELLLLLDDRCVALRFLRGETIASSSRCFSLRSWLAAKGRIEQVEATLRQRAELAAINVTEDSARCAIGAKSSRIANCRRPSTYQRDYVTRVHRRGCEPLQKCSQFDRLLR